MSIPKSILRFYDIGKVRNMKIVTKRGQAKAISTITLKLATREAWREAIHP